MLLDATDPRLTWQGVMSLRCGPEGVTPWRIQYRDKLLYSSEDLIKRAAIPAGVRISFISDTTKIVGHCVSPPDSGPIDLCCNGTFVGSCPVYDSTIFQFENLPPHSKLIELWLPTNKVFRLRSLELSLGSAVYPNFDSRPRWITYGSSITQCSNVDSPTQTWPSLVARACGLNLTCLGFNGQCHLDVMIGRMIRDTPADLVSICVGINILYQESLSPRTFGPAIVGFVQIIREKHPDIPMIVMSPIWHEPYEKRANRLGFTLPTMRDEVCAAVERLKAHGDRHIRYVDGLMLLASKNGHLLPDGIHPSVDGYRLIAKNFATYALADLFPVQRSGILPP